MIGQQVGNYVIESVLGDGAMGVVYAGKHQTLSKKVAIKFPSKDPTGQEETNKRFLREAETAASIDNPHIVEIYDFGELPNGQRYLIMELLKGTPLDKALEAAKGEPLPLPRLLNITHQLTVGMEAAHEAGIVHRDLKPSNIFLTRGSRGPDFVKILDFGIAYVSKSTTKLTERGVPIGTPDYLSPEQATGEPVDLRADIYSLGVILYELATGRVPFEGANQYEVVGKHIYAEPLPPRKQVSNPDLVPLDLEAIILKCLAKDPKKRYQSMREVGAALEQVGGGGFITSIHPQPITPSPPPSEVFVEGTGQGRRRLLALAALLSGAMLVGGSATVLWMRKKDEDSPSPTGPSTAPVTTEKPAPPAASSAKIIEPEKPQASVSVKITVKPKDARVSMNGQELGNGDMSIDLEAGQRIQVEIEKRGYQSQKLTLDGSKTHVPIELKPIATKSVPIKPPPPPPSSKPTEKKKPREFGEGVPSPW
jgi:serine/threonine-protein kinase